MKTPHQGKRSHQYGFIQTKRVWSVLYKFWVMHNYAVLEEKEFILGGNLWHSKT